VEELNVGVVEERAILEQLDGVAMVEQLTAWKADAMEPHGNRSPCADLAVGSPATRPPAGKPVGGRNKSRAYPVREDQMREEGGGQKSVAAQLAKLTR